MPERPVQRHANSSHHRTRDIFQSQADIESPISLTLRVGSPDGAQARARLEHLLRDIPDLHIMTVSHHRGMATLVLQAPRDELDAMLHEIMVRVPGAEFGPIQPAVLAAVH
jgi:hypothetical protein